MTRDRHVRSCESGRVRVPPATHQIVTYGSASAGGCDSLRRLTKTPAVKTWLQAHPRFQIHFTPTYSSWLNQVERFFAFVTEDLLQRSHHNTVQQLEADIRAWIKDWNTHPKPFIWTKSADEILESLGRLLKRISGAGH